MPKKTVKKELIKKEVKKTPKIVKKVAIVEWSGRSREYSLELHGKDFMKLAEQFASKVRGIVK